jgi:hypothetical protein
MAVGLPSSRLLKKHINYRYDYIIQSARALNSNKKINESLVKVSQSQANDLSFVLFSAVCYCIIDMTLEILLL